jgi:aldose 1-epimerase
MWKRWRVIGLCVAVGLIAGCAPKEQAPGAATGANQTADGSAGVRINDTWDTLPDGRAVALIELRNKNGIKARLINYGAALVGLDAPDRKGKFADVTLGFDKVEPYTGKSPYMGATVGRYANRIALGKFTLDGKEYVLATNNAPNHLHGGVVGYDKVIWKAEPFKGKDGVGVKFSYLSPDGEEGYPGAVNCSVTYTLTDANELRFDYEATTDKPTPLNLTNHSYWNLAGCTSGVTILNHLLTLHAATYTPTDDTFIPTGEIAPVAGTPVDFRDARAIGKSIAKIPGTPGGYDHNFVVDGQPGTLRQAATVTDPGSGRVMEVWTTEPGLQFYTGNFLDGTLTGKGGAKYQKNMALCLEAQKFPDSPNKPNFPTSILRPGEMYTQTTVHKFSVEK